MFNKQPKAPTRFVYSDDEADAVLTASIQPAIATNRQPISQYQGFNNYNLEDLHSDNLPIAGKI